MKVKIEGKTKDLQPVYANRLIKSGKAEKVDEVKKTGRPKSNKGKTETDEDK